MIQLLNNIWLALNIENSVLFTLLSIPATIVENFLFMTLFLIILNIKFSNKQQILYVVIISITGILSLNILPTPLNVFINYASIFLAIKFIFKLNVVHSFISLLIPTFIFALLNVLLQNPYMKLLDIPLESLLNIPIYRYSFLLVVYIVVTIICLAVEKIKSLNFSLDFINLLDKKTLRILIINLVVGFLTLCIQLILNTFYIDIVPLYISLLSFLFLTGFFGLSIYSYTRIIKLATTKRDLQNAEEYNHSLEILYDKVKGFKHDFNNIMSTFSGYLDNNDIKGAQSYLAEVKKDCKITNDLSILNPRVINNPGIYSLLNNKYFKASKLGIDINIEFFLDLSTLNINTYKFSRILGILLDNAIEASANCVEKIIRITFRRENKNNRAIILIKNTYSNKNIDLDEIFKKGISEKEEHFGIGLWEVRNYVKRSNNLNLFTNKTNKYFIQQLEIYD